MIKISRPPILEDSHQHRKWKESIKLAIDQLVDAVDALSVSGVTDGDKGDITVSGGGLVFTIDNGVVTFAKMQDISTSRLLGRSTSGSGDIEQISIGSGLSLSAGTLSATGGGGGGSDSFVRSMLLMGA